jgi:hypothetical protein
MPKNMSQAVAARQPVDPDGYLPATPVVAAAGERRLPTIKGYSWRFFMIHNPDQWALEPTADGWELIPVLKRLDIRPGVQGVSARKGNQPPDTKLLIGRMQEEGTTQIPNPESYMVSVESLRGPRYFTRWERVKAYPDGSWEMHHDDDGYRAWLRSLVPSVIAPPRDSVIGSMRRRLSKQIERASRQPHLPLAVKAVEEAEARLAGLDVAVAALRGAPPAEGVTDG